MKTKRCTLEWLPTHEVAAGALLRQKIKRNPTRPIHRSPRPSLSLKQRAFTLFYLLTSSKFIRSLFQAVTKFAFTAVISLLTTVYLRKAIRWS
jgi:hypothetical protein